jgi:hypothetical protein
MSICQETYTGVFTVSRPRGNHGGSLGVRGGLCWRAMYTRFCATSISIPCTASPTLWLPSAACCSPRHCEHFFGPLARRESSPAVALPLIHPTLISAFQFHIFQASTWCPDWEGCEELED